MRPAAFPASLPACTKLPEALSGTKRKGLSGGKERPDRGRRPLRCHVRHVSSKKGLFRISLTRRLAQSCTESADHSSHGQGVPVKGITAARFIRQNQTPVILTEGPYRVPPGNRLYCPESRPAFAFLTMHDNYTYRAYQNEHGPPSSTLSSPRAFVSQGTPTPFRHLRLSVVLESRPGNSRPGPPCAPPSLGYICGIAFQKVIIVR